MLEEITKNVNITLNIMSNIGFLFFMVMVFHFTGPYAYFTPQFMKDLPLWILGGAVGFLGRCMYKSYINRN